MNNDIKFLDIEWRTPYPLTNFEERFGLRASVIFLDSNICGFLFIWTLARSQTLVVNSTKVDLYCHQILLVITGPTIICKCHQKVQCCKATYIFFDIFWLSVVSYGRLNSLAPGKFEWNFRHVSFKQILVIDDWGISCEIALTWKPQDLTDGKSTLVQVMAWCRQATSHYLSQCWPSSLSPYDVTRP